MTETKYNKKSDEGKVLVLYTGGTIGMMRNKDEALTPVPNVFKENLKSFPNMHDSSYAQSKFGPGKNTPLVLPMAPTDTKRILYDVIEYSPLCDSSNMSVKDWIHIASDIKEYYAEYDGFVVLHGTDTLSYTASALSFMIEGLSKTIVITGSHLPIFERRSDGFSNLLGSLIVAGHYKIPEVCVFFCSQLMRGNRTIKTSTNTFEAFHSPNSIPLATSGNKIEVNHHAVFLPPIASNFNVHLSMNRNVVLLRLFPSITLDLVKVFLQEPTEGVVLQSYGSGNVGTNRVDIVSEIKKATSRGVIVVNISQCARGGVSDAYEAGKVLLEAGVTLGYDMTPEAALTKLSYVLSRSEWDITEKRAMVMTNLRGELTNECSSGVNKLSNGKSLENTSMQSANGNTAARAIFI